MQKPRNLSLGLFILSTLYLISFQTIDTNAANKNSKSSPSKFINPREHDVIELTDINFKSRIEQKRTDSVSFVMLCSTVSLSTNCKSTVQGVWNDIAKELHGMAFIGAVDCHTNAALCNKVNPNPSVETKEPIVVVFPAFPQSSYILDKPISAKTIKRTLSIHYPFNDVTTVTQENKKQFLESSAQLPKAIFFTEKAQPTLTMKVLAHEFDKKVNIGIVSSNETELVNYWKVKEFPSLKVIQNNGKVVDFNETKEVENPDGNTKGKKKYEMDFAYSTLYGWINIYAETFAMNSGVDETPKEQSDQPWKYEKIPELTEASHKKICFKNSKGICVIYLKNGGPLDDKETELLYNLKVQYDSDSSYRSTNFHWMWLNIKDNPAFEELFGVHEYPSLVVLNPFKRKRFFGLPNDVVATKDTITNMMEKVLGGDAQFKFFANLPPFNSPKPMDEL